LSFNKEHKSSDKVLIEINMNGIGFSINGLVISKDKLEELQSKILEKQTELLK